MFQESSSLMIYYPVFSEAVAAGLGVFRTCKTAFFRSKKKSYTKQPCGRRAWARTPELLSARAAG